MSNQRNQSLAIVAPAVPIDPEFAEVYAQTVSGKPDSESAGVNQTYSPKPQSGGATATAPGGSPEFEALEEMAAIAIRNQKTAIDRRTLPAGSFDQIENDLSNTLKLGWDILTR